MKKSLTSKLMLKRRLFALRMSEGTSLRDHLDQLNTIMLELCNIDEAVDDEDAALILLVSLPPSFENFMQSFIVGKDTVSLEEVRASLHERDMRHKETGAAGDNQASGLMASESRSGCKKGKHGKQHDKPSDQKRGPKTGDVCNYYKEKGH